MINPCPCIYSTNQKHTRTGTGLILALIKLKEKKKEIGKKSLYLRIGTLGP